MSSQWESRSRRGKGRLSRRATDGRTRPKANRSPRRRYYRSQQPIAQPRSQTRPRRAESIQPRPPSDPCRTSRCCLGHANNSDAPASWTSSSVPDQFGTLRELKGVPQKKIPRRAGPADLLGRVQIVGDSGGPPKLLHDPPVGLRRLAGDDPQKPRQVSRQPQGPAAPQASLGPCARGLAQQPRRPVNMATLIRWGEQRAASSAISQASAAQSVPGGWSWNPLEACDEGGEGVLRGQVIWREGCRPACAD